MTDKIPTISENSSRGRVVAIIQARMGSSRLPGKVLLDLAGKPMLARVVERVRMARSVNLVAIATTIEPSDDPVEAFCQEQGIPVTRGSLHDVLDRYYQAARIWQAGTVVRVTADCPLVDPGLIDATVDLYTRYHLDFAANRLPPPWKRTYPIGLDVEVCSFAALQQAWNEAAEPHQREHVLPYLYEEVRSVHYDSRTLPPPPLPAAPDGMFRVAQLNYSRDLSRLRWTVDTPPDLELARAIFARFPDREDFSWLEVLDVVEHEPELARLNAGVVHNDYRVVDDGYII
jgi:spore coat polysaccharide biosynthesis protein SpsF